MLAGGDAAGGPGGQRERGRLHGRRASGSGVLTAFRVFYGHFSGVLRKYLETPTFCRQTSFQPSTLSALLVRPAQMQMQQMMQARNAMMNGQQPDPAQMMGLMNTPMMQQVRRSRASAPWPPTRTWKLLASSAVLRFERMKQHSYILKSIVTVVVGEIRSAA